MENDRDKILKYIGLALIAVAVVLISFVTGALYNNSHSSGNTVMQNDVITEQQATIENKKSEDQSLVSPSPLVTSEPETENIKEQEQIDQPTSTPEPVQTPYYEQIPESLLPKPDQPTGSFIIIGPDVGQPDTPTTAGSEVTESDLANKIFKLINEERSAEEIKPLTYNKNLQTAADLRAMECATSFSHTRPDDTSCHTVVNVDYYITGENLIMADKPIVSAPGLVDAWMRSTGHRDNIMMPAYTSTAIGVYEQNDVVYVCQIFIG